MASIHQGLNYGFLSSFSYNQPSKCLEMIAKLFKKSVALAGCLGIGMLTIGCTDESDPVHVGYSKETYVNLINKEPYSIHYAELHLRFLVPLPNGERITDNYNVNYEGSGSSRLVLHAYKYHSFDPNSGITPYSEPIEIQDGVTYNVAITIEDLSSSYACVIRRDPSLPAGQYYVESPGGLDFITYGLQHYPYSTVNFDVTPANSLLASIVGPIKITLEHHKKVKKDKKSH